MTDVFATPDEFGDIRASELHASLFDRVSAEAADTLDPKNSPSGMLFVRRGREGAAAGNSAPFQLPEMGSQQQVDLAQSAAAAVPDTSIDDARERVKQEGLEKHLRLPDQPTIKSPVLDLMINEAHERRDREAAISRGPQGFFPGALGMVTSFGVGMIDPINAAAFSIPVLGEARMGQMIASAGNSIAARTGVRALQGGLQGAVGSAVLQPADWWLHTRDGQDYTMADVLHSVAFGAGLGAGAHSLFGTIGDLRRRARGMPLEGSPEDLLHRGLMTGTHVHGDELADQARLTESVSDDEVPGISKPEIGATVAPKDVPVHPAEIIADLPPAAQEDALRAAMADQIAGRPVRSAEMLQIAAEHDPRVAESFEAWHGSPHEFDRFSMDRIGTGEGAQSFGHGLYFAENAKVARGYQRTTSDKAFIDKVSTLYDNGFSPNDAWSEIKDHWKEFTPAEQRLMTALEKDDWLGFDYPHQAVSASLSARATKHFEMAPETVEAIKAIGNMYRVKISADREHLLDWDKPLSEQSEHVRSKLGAAGFADDQTGRDIYHSLVKHRPNQGGAMNSAGMKLSDLDATPENASGRLHATGIPGIRYLDKGSRAAGEGTRNFVIFDDKHIDIIDRNGESVAKPFTESAPGNPKIMLPDIDAGIKRLRDHVDASASIPADDIAAQRQSRAERDQHYNDARKSAGVMSHDEIVALGDHPRARHETERAGQFGELTNIIERDLPAARNLGGAPELPVHLEARAAELVETLRRRDVEPEPIDRARPPVDRAAAASDPAWHQLADAPPEYATPEAIEESRAADRVEEPASIEPEKAVTAAEKAAADAEEVLRKIEPSLTEDERRQIHEALDRVKQDKEARDRIITDGAACLAGALL